jgi:hypothetical protein
MNYLVIELKLGKEPPDCVKGGSLQSHMFYYLNMSGFCFTIAPAKASAIVPI